MRYSKTLIPTMKNIPTEAKIISHQLMLKSGLIKKVSSGFFHYLPIGLLIINKISKIIKEEINKIGGQEILMPLVQSAKLWKETKRWYKYGNLLFKLKDRKKNIFCLAPTHEEIITDLIRCFVKTYKQLPLILYQIHNKFRDEIRPKSGLLRSREFLMNDTYSFDINKKKAKESYRILSKTYYKIFQKCGLNFKIALASSGQIGGNNSHEFHALSNNGEDIIVSCTNCNYSANIEIAEVAKKKIK